MRLKNKTIIVSAAGQGIGKATALAFANEGARVIAVDINVSTLQNLHKENTNIEIKKTNVSKENEVENLSNEIKDIDVLFHAVGIVHHGTIQDCSVEEFNH